MPGTRKLGRNADHRTAMLRAMVTYLLENGKIETTVTRAKEVRSVAEKIITTAKRGDLHSKRQIFSFITKEAVAKKVIDEIAPNYAERNGGYTRIIRTGPVVATLPKWQSSSSSNRATCRSNRKPGVFPAGLRFFVLSEDLQNFALVPGTAAW